jgi:hypothetical protein
MRTDIEKILRERPLFLTRAGWTYHPPVYGEDGRFRYGFPEYDAFLEIAKQFYDKGVRVFLSNLPVGWVDEDTYDFSSLDETLSRMFSAMPEALYIPRVRLDPPFAWMEKHPEEVCVFENESDDPEIVRAQVKQRNVNNTYDMSVSPRPNGLQPLLLDAPIGLQSFSSERWLADAKKALERMMRHVLNGPYAKHFIGFHICFGGTCELLHWGNGGSRLGDFSRKHTDAFFDWAVKKYGSLAALSAAWEREEISREGFSVPPSSVRSKRGKSLKELYRLDGDGCYFRDYEIFHSETVISSFLALAEHAKSIAPELAVGVFYGYEGYGHEHLDRMLDSPYVDYLSAPKPYDDPVPGGRGGSVAKVSSIMRKKLWIEELDNRPHTAWDPRKFAAHINVAPAANFEESANVLWRELCKLEQDGAGFWWMDQGDAAHRWYADGKLMEMIGDMVKVDAALKKMHPRDIVEVALVSDTAANLMGGIRSGARRRMLTAGVPFHEYRMSDLDAIELSQYRLLIFTSPQLMTKAQLDAIRSRLQPECKLLFLDLPGIADGGAGNLYRVREITGIGVEFKETDAPASYASLAFADKMGGAIRERDGVYLCIDPTEIPTSFSDLFDAAGLTRRIRARGVVHGNGLLLGVFSMKDEGISDTVLLPEKGDYVEWFTKAEYKNTDSVRIDLMPKEARVFINKKLFSESAL